RGAATSASKARPAIGTNDALGWGPVAARKIFAAGIRWARVDLGRRRYGELPAANAAGFHTLAIVANVDDEQPLSTVEPAEWGQRVVTELQANPGIAIAEAGNESYFKGGVADPVSYGRMYLAAVQDMRAAGIRTPLLFNMTGDIPVGTWEQPQSWSRDADGGGWLRTAVQAVPGLAAAILANGVSSHPYGAVGESAQDDHGTGAVAAQEAVARQVLGAVPPFYITEFGFALNRCGSSLGACSTADQARMMLAAYRVFLSDPHVAGIWWYQSHDDSTGDWGFMTDQNQPRPSMHTLSTIARTVAR
ncbi:MAG TPA: hypothetical protein VL977_02245, partial [Solirubrobacteraceae bacterium]|nr:hypothetical protein [Solirubrobacteraceae bacterium]